MSNYKTKAKKPNGTEFEEVSMLDNFFGQHNYGVEFPDGAIYRPEKCDFEEEKSKTPNQDIIKEFKEEFRITPDRLRITFSVEKCINFLQKAISQTQKEAYEKGRLETIKEIEEKLDNRLENMKMKLGSNRYITNSIIDNCISEVKSILNQLKDNGKY